MNNIKNFNEFMNETDSKLLTSQTSYGKYLQEAARHMINNTKLYCDTNNLDFDSSKFEITFKVVSESDTQTEVEKPKEDTPKKVDEKPEKSEPKEPKEPKETKEK